mgnify:CR=1 FL=1
MFKLQMLNCWNFASCRTKDESKCWHAYCWRAGIAILEFEDTLMTTMLILGIRFPSWIHECWLLKIWKRLSSKFSCEFSEFKLLWTGNGPLAPQCQQEGHNTEASRFGIKATLLRSDLADADSWTALLKLGSQTSKSVLKHSESDPLLKAVRQQYNSAKTEFRKKSGRLGHQRLSPMRLGVEEAMYSWIGWIYFKTIPIIKMLKSLNHAPCGTVVLQYISTCFLKLLSSITHQQSLIQHISWQKIFWLQRPHPQCISQCTCGCIVIRHGDLNSNDKINGKL